MAESYAQAAFTNGYEFTQGTGYKLPEYPFQVPPEIDRGRRPRRPAGAVTRRKARRCGQQRGRP